MYVSKNNVLPKSRSCPTKLVRRTTPRASPRNNASEGRLPRRAPEEVLDAYQCRCMLPHIASHPRKAVELIPRANQIKAIFKRAPFAGFILQNNYAKMEEHYYTKELKLKQIKESPELENTFI